MASDILIVDDEADIRELVAGILQDEPRMSRFQPALFLVCAGALLAQAPPEPAANAHPYTMLSKRFRPCFIDQRSVGLDSKLELRNTIQFGPGVVAPGVKLVGPHQSRLATMEYDVREILSREKTMVAYPPDSRLENAVRHERRSVLPSRIGFVIYVTITAVQVASRSNF